VTPAAADRARGLALVVLAAVAACGGKTQLPSHSPDCAMSCATDDAIVSSDHDASVEMPAHDAGTDGALDLPPDVAADVTADIASDVAADGAADVTPDLAPDAPQMTPDVAVAPRDAGSDGPDAAEGLAIEPPVHDFETTIVGYSDDRFTFTVSNRGGTTLSGLTVAVTGADYALVAARDRCAGVDTLSPGASCQLDVRFSAASPGFKRGFIVVSTSDQSVTSSLTGTARTPPHLTIRPESQSFVGAVGHTSAPASFTVTNEGETETTVEVHLYPGSDDFTITSDPCGTLVSGESCQVQVAFRPGSPGTRTGSLLARASTNIAATSQLTGTAAPAAKLIVTPDMADFGTVAVNATSPPKTFVVKNVGGSATHPLRVPGTSTGEFSVSASTCTGIALAPNETCSLSIVFAPTSSGPKQATAIVYGEAVESVRVELTGSAP